jgi:hypothetical protein
MTPYRIPAPLKLRVMRAEVYKAKTSIHALATDTRLDQLEALLDETRHELDRTRVQLRSLRIIACLYMLAATWVAFFWRM